MVYLSLHKIMSTERFANLYYMGLLENIYKELCNFAFNCNIINIQCNVIFLSYRKATSVTPRFKMLT